MAACKAPGSTDNSGASPAEPEPHFCTDLCICSQPEQMVDHSHLQQLAAL